MDRTDGTVRVFAYNVREDWETKLREDCRRIAEGNHKANEVVFLSTHRMSVLRRELLREDLRSVYGLGIEFYDIERIRALLVGPLKILIGRHPSTFVPLLFGRRGEEGSRAEGDMDVESVAGAERAVVLRRELAAASALPRKWPLPHRRTRTG